MMSLSSFVRLGGLVLVVLVATAGVAQAVPLLPDAPELNPGSLATALSLLTCGVLLLRGRGR
jgi:hypothetical protein